NPDDVRMAHRGDQLVLEQKALEQPAARLAWPVLDDLADDPLARLLVLGEVDPRQVGCVELRDESMPPGAEPSGDARREGPRARARLELAFPGRAGGAPAHLCGRRPALERVAQRGDEPPVLQLALREVAYGARLQRVDGEPLVARIGEEQHRRAIAPLGEPVEPREALLVPDRVAEQHGVETGERDVARA